MNAEELIHILFDYFEVDNNLDLAKKMDISPQTVTNWKRRNAVPAIRKKCRDLGIFNDIFGDSTIVRQNIKENPGMAIGNVQGDNISGAGKIEEQIDDPVALALFIQAWKVAKERGNIKELKIKLMDFCDDG